jgi:hypothetical protein
MIVIVLLLIITAAGFLAFGWGIWQELHPPVPRRYTPIASLFSTGSGRFLPSDKGRRVTVDGQACEIVEVLSATSITIRPIK